MQQDKEWGDAIVLEAFARMHKLRVRTHVCGPQPGEIEVGSGDSCVELGLNSVAQHYCYIEPERR
jgi:hypothetical protein